ncbi:MAG TPA: rhodanese-like domain-containing protein [Bacillales bacterium]|nr:rhodanese-like domain-containing protein [Bacillales bacterium]
MFGSVEKISAEEVRESLQAKQSLQLIDVRTKEEVAGGKIPGARNLPLNELPQRMKELDRSKEYVMVCRSGARSSKAAKLLKKNGFSVKNMSGGMKAWKWELS